MASLSITRLAGSLIPIIRNTFITESVITSLRLCSNISNLDAVAYDKVCTETLESLTDYFEEIIEDADHLKLSDISYGDGVLTVNFGPKHGSYVINRQTPNKQIWLSSPSTGPKRYDFIGSVDDVNNGKWVYKHTGKSLHELLQDEIKNIAKIDVDFFKLPYSKIS